MLGLALCAFSFTLLFGSSLVMTAPDFASRVAMSDMFMLMTICTWLGLSAALARDAFQDAKSASMQECFVKSVRRQQL